MTLDAYGRYVGRHRDWHDDPPGYSIVDPDRPADRLSGLLDEPEDGDRYGRPMVAVPVPRAPLFVEPRRPLTAAVR